MSKIALLSYHKNADKIYKPEWIEEYKQSILNQTYKDFDIFEMNYNGDNYRIFENSFFESFNYPTFIHALNYLMNKVVAAGYDCAANTNVDDAYDIRRLGVQLPYIAKGFDIVSSNFSLSEDDKIIKTHSFDKLDIKVELSNNHNIVCHPSIMYSRKFMENNKYIPEQLPLEDLMLWQRSIENGFKFIILPEILCLHRLHNQSVCQSENR